MEFIYHQPSFKGIAGQMAKDQQQHIVEVRNEMIYFFNNFYRDHYLNFHILIHIIKYHLV